MIGSLLTGLGIGLAAGVSPGPLLVLVVTATLRGGLRSGVATAAAPLLSDLVVVAVVLLTLGQLPAGALGWLGLVGGLAVAWMGVQTVRQSRTATLDVAAGTDAGTARSLGQGVLVNLLSPHPWISWLTMLGPLTLTAAHASPGHGVALVAGFYLTLVGAKVALAGVVAGGRGRLTDRAYRRVLVVAGIALVALGLAMAVEFGSKLR